MITRKMKPAHRGSLPRICATWLFVLVTLGSCYARAQGPAQGQLPAFDDPSFRDRLWEAGGPEYIDHRSGKLILSVTIEGESTVSENKILSHMQSRPDRAFDQEQLNRDIRELHRTDLFFKIEPYVTPSEDGEGVHILLRVYEKPTVRKVVYHGNKRMEDRQLKKHSGIDVGDPIGPASVEQAKNRMLDLYRDKGFGSADIQIVEGGRPGDRNVVFRISEGELERIWDITFVGNEAFASDLLKTKIKSRDARNGLTSHMFNAADGEQFRDDQQALEAYYRRLGYFDARVDFFKRYDESGKWVYLTFAISEGKQYHVNQISVRGNKYHTSEELLSGMTLKAGEPFHQDKMDRDARRIREIYGAQGFIFVDVVPEPYYLPGEKINLVFDITEGDVYRASDVRVHIAGDSSYTKERVVTNLIGDRIRPGRIIDARELDHGRRRLGASGIFEVNPQLGEPPEITVQPVEEEDLDEEPSPSRSKRR